MIVVGTFGILLVQLNRQQIMGCVNNKMRFDSRVNWCHVNTLCHHFSIIIMLRVGHYNVEMLLR